MAGKKYSRQGVIVGLVNPTYVALKCRLVFNNLKALKRGSGRHSKGDDEVFKGLKEK